MRATSLVRPSLGFFTPCCDFWDFYGGPQGPFSPSRSSQSRYVFRECMLLSSPSSLRRHSFVVVSREEESSSNNIYVSHEDDCETKTGGSTNLRVGLFIHCFSFFGPPETIRCKTLSRRCAVVFYVLFSPSRLIFDIFNIDENNDT